MRPQAAGIFRLADAQRGGIVSHRQHFPGLRAHQSMLGQRAKLRKLRKDHRHAAANGLAGLKGALRAEEQPLGVIGWNPRRDVCAMLIDFRARRQQWLRRFWENGLGA